MKLVTYCSNPVKLIKTVGRDEVMFFNLKTNQILTKPISSLDVSDVCVDLGGFLAQQISILREEERVLKIWEKNNS